MLQKHYKNLLTFLTERGMFLSGSKKRCCSYRPRREKFGGTEAPKISAAGPDRSSAVGKEDAMKKIRVGVAGYGTIGQRLADGVALQGDMELVGIADLAPTLSLQALRERDMIGENGVKYHLYLVDGADEAAFREKDIPSGPVQHNIEDWEKLLSDCNENVKYYAYQILFLSGGAVSLPNANFGGKVIGSKTVDGDAKILEPADASNTLDIAFKKTYNAICDGSKSVFIKPEDLKGQNDSGAYIANLYWPEIQWAKLFYGRYHKCMVKILRVFRKLVGLI